MQAIGPAVMQPFSFKLPLNLRLIPAQRVGVCLRLFATSAYSSTEQLLSWLATLYYQILCFFNIGALIPRNVFSH